MGYESMFCTPVMEVGLSAIRSIMKGELKSGWYQREGCKSSQNLDSTSIFRTLSVITTCPS